MFELELDGRAVGQHARDAAVVFVAHHDGRHRLGHVEGAVVEGADLAVLAAGVVDAADRAGGDQELIELFGDLRGRDDVRVRAALRSAAAEVLLRRD